jgi:hypothetical protein
MTKAPFLEAGLGDTVLVSVRDVVSNGPYVI